VGNTPALENVGYLGVFRKLLISLMMVAIFYARKQLLGIFCRIKFRLSCHR